MRLYLLSDNNYCGLQAFNDPNVSTRTFCPSTLPNFLFISHGISRNGICCCTSSMRRLTSDRDKWAKTDSPNKDVKVYIGAPAAPQAASHGYVNAETLASYAAQMRNQYSSFGGIMLWDASWAHGVSLCLPSMAFRAGFHHVCI